MIPQAFIDELLIRTDLVEFIDSFVPLKKQGNNYTACCPFHQEKSPSFNVIPNKQFYYCFGCGASGNAISFAMNYQHLTFRDAIDTLALRIGLEVPHEHANVKTLHSPRNLTSLLDQVSQFYEQQLKTNITTVKNYIQQRGLNPEIITKYHIGFAPNGWHNLQNVFKDALADLVNTGMLIVQEDGKQYDRFRQRLMFPIHDYKGKIIAFGGRALDPEAKPKYLNSPETPIFQKNRELYGLYQVLTAKEQITSIVVVEGYMDVVSLAQHGIFNVVGTLGTATSSFHIQRLGKYTRHLQFCFDGDNAGKKAAWRALEQSLEFLNTGLEVSFIFLPEGEDPDSLVRKEGAENFKKRLEEPTPFLEFFFKTLTSDLKLKSFADKSRLIHIMKPYLQKIGPGPFQQLIYEEITRLTHIETDRLNQIMSSNHEVQTNISHGIARTPVRIAIALLLQHPEIYRLNQEKISEATLNSLHQYPILVQLLAQVSASPDITTGMLLELWRDSEHFDALSKLIAWDPKVPTNALGTEFLDTLKFLSSQSEQLVVDDLIKKARYEGLSAAERQELHNLLKKRHAPQPKRHYEER